MPNVESLLRDHVTLQVDCIDRLYLNGYVPRLQRPENLWWFFIKHRQNQVLSPALLKQVTDRFVGEIKAFADRHAIPLVYFDKGVRKEEVAQRHLRHFKGQEGVLFIGVAQERVTAFRAYQKDKGKRPKGQPPCFRFFKGPVFVNQYYFYILDREFGLCFIKFSSFMPFGIKVWLNGHEWAKRQLQKRGIRYTDLDNGFGACADPRVLQEVCDSLSPEHVDAFFRGWLSKLPHPFEAKDRQEGYRYALSIMQMEVSLTQVFDRPLNGRYFFEEVIRDNLDLGRPDRVQLLFERRVTRRTPGQFRTRVLTAGVQPSLRFDYKRTRVKQYFKLERALRTETTFNNTNDFSIGRSLGNLPRLRTLGRNINHRLLTLERTAHNCAVSSRTVEQTVLPTTDEDGLRAPALRWGDPRVMALFSSICGFVASPEGFTNRTLRPRVVSLLGQNGGAAYSSSRMTYDLRRLRLKGIIQRVPRSHRYVLSPRGRRIALFFSKTFSRIVRPCLHRTDPALPDDASDQLRLAWHELDRLINSTIADARIATG